MTPNYSHPYHWPPQRFRLEVGRLCALDELDAALRLAHAHSTGEDWEGMTAFLSQKEEKVA